MALMRLYLSITWQQQQQQQQAEQGWGDLLMCVLQHGFDNTKALCHTRGMMCLLT
jgi:hypothetical protein